MKYQQFQKLIATVLVGTLALATGCFSGNTETPSGPVAMGRFLEEELPLPENLSGIAMFTQNADGDLVILGEQGGGTGFGPWALLKSTDEGESWTDITPPALTELDGMGVGAAALGADGSLYVSAFKPPQGESDEPAASDYTTAVYSESGETVIPLPEEAYENLILGQILPVDENRLMLVVYDNVQVYDVVSGELQSEFTLATDAANNGSVLVNGELLAVTQDDAIAQYKLSDGSEASSITAAPMVTTTARIFTSAPSYGDRVIAMDSEKKAYYFCDAGGIYRVLFASPSSERLIDGEQTSLNMPSMVPLRLFAMSSGAMLVYGENGVGNPVLFRYRYDETVPTVPETELRIYSLQENPTIRQAMGEFQRANPQLKVTYLVGVGEDGAVTIPDAARSLATEILAGKGPDVLVLDGLPIQSYIQKGVLADLSGPLSEILSSPDYLQNLLGAYRQEGGAVYAVPARFTAPVALGEEDAVALHGPDALLAWMQQQPGTRIQFLNELGFIDYFYAGLYPTWLDAQGAIDEQALLQTLRTAESVFRLEGMGDKRHLYNTTNYTVETLGTMWANESARLGWADVSGVMGINAIYSAVEERGTGAFEIGLGQNISYPGTVLGINSGSEQSEKAVEFIRLALREDLQRMNFDDGLPVHRQALLFAVRGKESEPIAMNLGAADFDDGFIKLRIYWAPETYVETFLKKLEGTTPVHVDGTVKAIVLAEIEKMVYESAGAENTAAAIKRTVDLYLSEQR